MASGTYGFNFRATSGYVTDLTDETYALGENSAQTRNGITFSWSVSQTANARDRNAATDRRLAGVNQESNTTGTVPVFNITLPATGDYTIRMAAGDFSNAQAQDIEFGDNTTYTTVSDNNATATNVFADATNTDRSNANWASQNVSINKTFTTTTFKIRITNLTASGSSTTLAHLLLVQASDTLFAQGAF